MSKLWFSFERAMFPANSIVQLDLIELTQYLSETVMLMSHKFNVITRSRGLNLFSAKNEKQKAKNIIKDQEELVK